MKKPVFLSLLVLLILGGLVYFTMNRTTNTPPPSPQKPLTETEAQATTSGTDTKNYVYEDNEVCGSCHTEKLADYKNSLMGQTPHDQVFLQFYGATNAKGKKDGIGFRAFKPEGESDCANCHTPGEVLDTGHELALEDTIKMGSKGISCDYCHTIKDVKVIYDKMTGRYDTRIWKTVTRARGKTKFGPLKDAKSPYHGTAYSPIHQKPEFCAACHLNQEHLLSLDTYDSWKKAFDTGVITQTCQDCHMPTGGKDRPIAAGGPVRPASQIHRHTFHGGHNAEMVKKAVTVTPSVSVKDGTVNVSVDVKNSGAGHTFPGAATIRNVILVVDAVNTDGQPLRFTGDKKEILPPLAGMGKAENDFGGRVGAMFARPFATKTGQAPTGGFNADHAIFDTRIKPGATTHRVFHFKAPAKGRAKVRIRLIYRWTYKPMADKKGWDMKDIVITDKVLEQ